MSEAETILDIHDGVATFTMKPGKRQPLSGFGGQDGACGPVPGGRDRIQSSSWLNWQGRQAGVTPEAEIEASEWSTA